MQEVKILIEQDYSYVLTNIARNVYELNLRTLTYHCKESLPKEFKFPPPPTTISPPLPLAVQRCAIYCKYTVWEILAGLRGAHCNVAPVTWNRFSAFKGTVSPDIGYYFRVWKIKSVLFVELLIIFTVLFHIVFDVLKLIYLSCFYKNAY